MTNCMANIICQVLSQKQLEKSMAKRVLNVESDVLF